MCFWGSESGRRSAEESAKNEQDRARETLPEGFGYEGSTRYDIAHSKFPFSRDIVEAFKVAEANTPTDRDSWWVDENPCPVPGEDWEFTDRVRIYYGYKGLLRWLVRQTSGYKESQKIPIGA